MDTSHQKHHTENLPAILGTKPTFYVVFLSYHYDDEILDKLAGMAKVPIAAVRDMFSSIAIRRKEAEKILVAFSEVTGKTWTFDNVKVSLLPTFKEVCTTHGLDIYKLAMESNRIPYAVFDMMLEGEPVSEIDARLALQRLTFATNLQYTLYNVDVALEA